MASIIKFDQGAHWYQRTGEAKHDANLRDARKLGLYPSVTTIDKEVFRNEFLEKWKLNQIAQAAHDNPKQPHEDLKAYANRIYEVAMEKATNAAAFGGRIHKACENHPQAPEADLLPWFQKFATWHQENVDSVVFAEKTVLDHDCGIAGRADLCVILKNGRRTMVDYKSQDVKTVDGKKKPNFYDAWPRQLSFYAVADGKETGVFPQVSDCLSLVIDSNPDGEIYPKMWTHEEILSAYEDFQAMAWFFFKKRGYWPVGQWQPSFYNPNRQIPLPS